MESNIESYWMRFHSFTLLTSQYSSQSTSVLQLHLTHQSIPKPINLSASILTVLTSQYPINLESPHKVQDTCTNCHMPHCCTCIYDLERKKGYHFTPQSVVDQLILSIGVVLYTDLDSPTHEQKCGQCLQRTAVFITNTTTNIGKAMNLVHTYLYTNNK